MSNFVERGAEAVQDEADSLTIDISIEEGRDIFRRAVQFVLREMAKEAMPTLGSGDYYLGVCAFAASSGIEIEGE